MKTKASSLIDTPSMTDEQILTFLRSNITPSLCTDPIVARAILKEAKRRIASLDLTKDELIFISLVSLD